MSLPIKFRLFNPFYRILQKYEREWLELRYFKAYHRRMNTKNPELYHDKIFWLLMNTDVTEWGRLADKYAVREYVAAKLGEDVLPRLLGVYSNASEIDFDSLPDAFVLKTNNACATNIIVRDKASLDIDETRRRLNCWLGLHFGALTAERHYSLIKPRIIAEELLVDNDRPDEALIDYKVECFDGKPFSCIVYSDRVEGTHIKKYMMYDLDWKPMKGVFDSDDVVADRPLPRPACWEELKRMAAVLSEGFTYVRVDFYVVNGRPVFGEMSFTPGVDTHYSLNFQKVLGDMIKLPAHNDKTGSK